MPNVPACPLQRIQHTATRTIFLKCDLDDHASPLLKPSMASRGTAGPA